MTFKNISQIEIVNRKKPSCKPEDYVAYRPDEDMIPPMASFGEGYRYHVTGLTHDETGFPTNSSHVSEGLIRRIVDKVEKNIDNFSYYEEYRLEDAEIVIIAYGEYPVRLRARLMNSENKILRQVYSDP